MTTRKEIIKNGANHVWEWVNNIDNNERVEYSREKVKSYTVEDVIAEAEVALMDNYFQPLTAKEREWVAAYAEKVIAEARKAAGIKEEEKEEPKEEPKSYVEQIKELTKAIKCLEGNSIATQCLIEAREKLYQEAIAELKAAMS